MAAVRASLPVIVLALFVSSAAPAAELSAVSVYAGAFDVKDATFDNPEAGFELRLTELGWEWLPEWLPLAPIAGAAGTGEGNFWVYAGMRYDWRSPVRPRGDGFGMPGPPAGGRFGLAVSFAVGFYEEGSGRDLGGAVEFRSYGEINLRVGRAARLGLGVHHLSNAGLYDPNPGSESLLLSLTFPLR